MARSTLNYQQIARTGLDPTLAAANVDGNQFANDGRMFLRVVNGSGAPINVTIQTPGTVEGLAIAERVVSVTNGETRDIGPFAPNIYNQSDGMVYVDYAAVGSLTVAVLRL